MDRGESGRSCKSISMAMFKLAAVQAEPAWFDIDAGIKKAIDYITESAEAGANLVAFGECWLGGYPFYVWAGNPAFAIQFHAAFMLAATIDPEDPADKVRVQRLCDAARDGDDTVGGMNFPPSCGY